jgi:hypothetical protein
MPTARERHVDVLTAFVFRDLDLQTLKEMREFARGEPNFEHPVISKAEYDAAIDREIARRQAEAN